jgi:hypothetical protein
MYSVETGHWSMLPELNEAKASSSLCIINETILYCFGGLSRNETGGAFLNNSIEALNFSLGIHAKWEKL